MSDLDYAVGSAAWPEVAVSRAHWAEALQRLDLRRVTFPADLYLALACTRGDRRALEHFEHLVLARLDGALARLDPRPDAIDEARQRVREHLLVATATRPCRLAQYRGDAPLWTWVKTVAVRQLVDAARERGPLEPNEAERAILEVRLVSSTAVELGFLNAAVRPKVTLAFTQALASLDDRERHLVRLAFLEQQSSDRIAALYGTSRATAHRWVAAARAALVDRTRGKLAQALSLTPPELNSLMLALDGHLEQSLRHYFDPPP